MCFGAEKAAPRCYRIFKSFLQNYSKQPRIFELCGLIALNSLIKRVEVYRGYKVHVEFNIDYQQFCSGVEPAESVA